MKALTIRQPWGGAIFRSSDPKLVENRTQAYKHRGPLLIHTAQTLADAAAFDLYEQITGEKVPVFGSPGSGPEWTVGAIIGVVELTRVHSSAECGCRCSPWAFKYRQHHELTRPRIFRRPVPGLGRQGLWQPDKDTLTRVVRELNTAMTR